MNLEYYLNLQQQLASKVNIPAAGEGYKLRKDHFIFSFDICYKKDSAFIGCVVDKWEGAPVSMFVARFKVDFPYIPRLFCFREGPPILGMLRKIQAQFDYIPNLIIVEGHGIAHPVKCGLACWVGVHTDIPVIGCAKSTLLPYPPIAKFVKGDHSLIELKGDIVGATLISKDNVKPIFISPGHKVNIIEAIKIILSFTPHYRIPEPLRRADHIARLYAKGETLSAVKDLGQLV